MHKTEQWSQSNKGTPGVSPEVGRTGRRIGNEFLIRKLAYCALTRSDFDWEQRPEGDGREVGGG